MTMRQFADHVIFIANTKANGISNLQLQKVIYFSMGNHIKKYGIDNTIREMYDEPFEAWTYGPVVPSEYFRYRQFGKYNIRNSGIENPDYQIFDTAILKYVQYNVNALVEESHMRSTWKKNRQFILQHQKVVYKLEDLENDFAG